MSVIVMICFARSGGTVLNQCLGSLPNVVMLSEVNPLGGGWGKEGAESFTTPKAQARRWYGIELRSDDFAEGILELEEICEKSGRHLIIRDWTYVNFMPNEKNNREPPGRFLILEALEGRCKTIPFAFVRDSIDAWTSSGYPKADDYFVPYLRYVRALREKGMPVYKYEDFCRDPSMVIRDICEYSGLEFSDSYMNYASFTNVNGDVQLADPSRGVRQRKIKMLSRRQIPGEKVVAVDHSNEMVEANTLLDYPSSYWKVPHSDPPLVSVLLPVYNGVPYLEEAVRSVLAQTYDNFELIIVDDGSTDESGSVIGKFKDPRIRSYEQENQGLAATLNRAIKLARGKYLARQDQDDISFPLRFEKQVTFLETYPDYGMVGTWSAIRDGDKEAQRKHKHPEEGLILKFWLLFNNPFVHSSVMIRKEALEKVGLYSTDKSRQPPEDYELWSRIAREFEVANIPEVLHIYREVPRSMSRSGRDPFLEKVVKISAENLAWATGRSSSERSITDLAAITHGAYRMVRSKPDFQEISSILFEAADRLSDSLGVQRGRLRTLAQQRLNDAKYRYKYGFMNVILRRIAKRFGGLT